MSSSGGGGPLPAIYANTYANGGIDDATASAGANLTSTLIAQLRLPGGAKLIDSTSSANSGGGSSVDNTGSDNGATTAAAAAEPLPMHGAFVDSCSRHCTGSGPHWISGTIGEVVDGMHPLQALAQWYRAGAAAAAGSAANGDGDGANGVGAGASAGAGAGGDGDVHDHSKQRRRLWQQGW